jgi:hypothetical protein
MLWFLNLPAKLTLLFDIYKQLELLSPANVYILNETGCVSKCNQHANVHSIDLENVVYGIALQRQSRNVGVIATAYNVGIFIYFYAFFPMKFSNSLRSPIHF